MRGPAPTYCSGKSRRHGISPSAVLPDTANAAASSASAHELSGHELRTLAKKASSGQAARPIGYPGGDLRSQIRRVVPDGAPAADLQPPSRMTKKLLAIATLSGILGSASPSSADLIVDSGLFISGGGLGSVNTVLTMQQNPAETGCVEWTGAVTVGGSAACELLGGPPFGAHTKTGSGQIGTPALVDIDITNALALVIVFNANEPSSNSITLEQLALKIFRADGTMYFSDTLAAAVSFASTDPGTGNAGFSFVLTPGAAAVWNGLGLLGTDRVGLEARASSSAGGPDTFFAAKNPNFVPPPPAPDVPEPFTLALLGTGLVGFAGRHLRRR